MLKGFSYDLGKRLVTFFSDGTSDFATLPANAVALSITFTSNFKGVTSGNEITGNGIKLNTRTGVVTALSGAVTHPRQNFVIAVEADGTSVSDAPLRIYIRVHIHNDISHKWLTPSTLTVRRGMVDKLKPEKTNMKLSAYAQFDDGVIGDITNYCGFEIPTTANSIKWSPAGQFDFNFDGMIVVPPANVVGSEVEITAEFPSSLKGGIAKAKLKISEEWKVAKKHTARLLPGSAGVAKRNEVPNILFLCEGFLLADKTIFEDAVLKLIHGMKTENIFQPFSILLSSMNYWSVFTESAERGTTNDNDYYKVSGTATDQVISSVPVSRKPVDKIPLTIADINKWTIRDLLFFVGPPAPGQTVGTLKNDWYETLVLDSNDFQNKLLIEAIFDQPTLRDQWLKLTDRRLINKKNTFFGVTIGYPPDANIDRNQSNVLFHLKGDRVDRDKLDAFLSSLEDDKQQSLQGLWSKKADDTNGKDFDLVVIIINNHYGRVNNADGFFFIDAQEQDIVVSIDNIKVTRDTTAPAGINPWVEITSAPPVELPLISQQTFVHELAHSFALEDEYGEKFEGATEDIRKTDYHYKFPPIEKGKPDPNFVNRVGMYSNLQSEADLVSPTGDILGDKIKWRWHRIENAAVVNGIIVDKGGGKFEVPLRSGHPQKFKKDEVVILRLRVEDSYTSDTLEVVSFTDATHEMEIKAAAASFITKGLMLLFYYESVIHSTVAGKKPSYISKVTALAGGNFKIELIGGHQSYTTGETIKLFLPGPSYLNDLDNTTISVPLKIDNDQAGDLVTVKAETGTINLNDIKQFIKGSILYKPVEARPSVKSPTYRFSELLPKNVLSAINLKKIPLTGSPSKYSIAKDQILIPEYANTIQFPKIWCTGKKNMIVGIFSGGKGFHTGIFHPTGHCMMRAFNHNKAAKFCPVCKYILVDIIDPTKHGEIDNEIEALYPIAK
jgi:hypothetical protein